MEFDLVSTEKVDLLNSGEVRVFVRPLEKYLCPVCEKSKRKLVSEFLYFSKKHQEGKNFTLRPVCENCFELEVYSDLIERFYKLMKEK